MNGKEFKTGDEARKKTKKIRWGWFIYFAFVFIFTFFPPIYPYNVVDPMIMGIPVHLFKWFVSTILLIGGIIVFEFTAFSKLRGDDR